MKLKTEQYLDNATVPYTKIKMVFEIVNEFFDEHDINDADFLTLVLDIRNERSASFVHGIDENHYVVEIFYPCSTFKDSLIKERIVIFKSLVITGVSLFFEASNKPKNYINQLEARLSEI